MLDIRDYESMAKLCLSDDERVLIAGRAKMLCDSFSALENVYTENTAPLISPLELNNIFREDKAYKPFSRDEILLNAPEQSGGYFKVPGTLE